MKTLEERLEILEAKALLAEKVVIPQLTDHTNRVQHNLAFHIQKGQGRLEALDGKTAEVYDESTYPKPANL